MLRYKREESPKLLLWKPRLLQMLLDHTSHRSTDILTSPSRPSLLPWQVCFRAVLWPDASVMDRKILVHATRAQGGQVRDQEEHLSPLVLQQDAHDKAAQNGCYLGPAGCAGLTRHCTGLATRRSRLNSANNPRLSPRPTKACWFHHPLYEPPLPQTYVGCAASAAFDSRCGCPPQ